MKEILEFIGKGEYVGVTLAQLQASFLGKDIDAPDENEYLKFVYHMDEIFDAQLIKSRELGRKYRWGKVDTLDGGRHYQNNHLILTPIGGEVLKELNKPKGLDKFIHAVRSVGAMTGQEAIKYGIGELFKTASS